MYEEPPKKTQEAVNQEEDEGADDLGPDHFDGCSIVLCSQFSR